MCLCQISGQVGTHIDGCHLIHDRDGVGNRNLEGRMLLECFLEKALYIVTVFN